MGGGVDNFQNKTKNFCTEKKRFLVLLWFLMLKKFSHKPTAQERNFAQPEGEKKKKILPGKIVQPPSPSNMCVNPYDGQNPAHFSSNFRFRFSMKLKHIPGLLKEGQSGERYENEKKKTYNPLKKLREKGKFRKVQSLVTQRGNLRSEISVIKVAGWLSMLENLCKKINK